MRLETSGFFSKRRILHSSPPVSLCYRSLLGFSFRLHTHSPFPWKKSIPIPLKRSFRNGRRAWGRVFFVKLTWVGLELFCTSSEKSLLKTCYVGEGSRYFSKTKTLKRGSKERKSQTRFFYIFSKKRLEALLSPSSFFFTKTHLHNFTGTLPSNSHIMCVWKWNEM